tara:strand:+ start:93386 stop:94252 length:867 start_codon:yes stop_codon:yes gene_type:complete
MTILKSLMHTCLIVGLFSTGSGCQTANSQSTAHVVPSQFPKQLSAQPIPDVASLKLAFARSLEAGGEVERAMAVYHEVLQHDDKLTDAHWRLGLIQSKRGELDEALIHFKSALRSRPNDADIYCDLGYALYLQNSWTEAEDCLRKAISLSPEHQRSHMNLALLLARSNRQPESEREFLAGGCSRETSRSNLAIVASFQHGDPEGCSVGQLSATDTVAATSFPLTDSRRAPLPAQGKSSRRIPLSCDAPNSHTRTPTRIVVTPDAAKFAPCPESSGKGSDVGNTETVSL